MDDPARSGPLSGGSGGSGESPLVPEGLDATIVLLRHGESTFIVEGRFQGQAETPLSPTGLRQADLAALRLARPSVTPSLPVPAGRPREIVHSPLTRTTQTAEAVQRAIRDDLGSTAGSADAAPPAPPPLRPEPGIAEIAQGEWEGLHRSEIMARYADTLAAWRRRPLEAWAPGGESIEVVRGRVAPAIRRLLAPLAGAGDPGDADRSMVPGPGMAPPGGPWSIVVGHDGVFKVFLLALLDLPLDRFWTFPFALCGITIVEFVGGRPALRAHNLTEHLAPLDDEQARELAAARERSGAL